jgi:hypothetical protein
MTQFESPSGTGSSPGGGAQARALLLLQHLGGDELRRDEVNRPVEPLAVIHGLEQHGPIFVVQHLRVCRRIRTTRRSSAELS